MLTCFLPQLGVRSGIWLCFQFEKRVLPDPKEPAEVMADSGHYNLRSAGQMQPDKDQEEISQQLRDEDLRDEDLIKSSLQHEITETSLKQPVYKLMTSCAVLKRNLDQFYKCMLSHPNWTTDMSNLKVTLQMLNCRVNQH